jgi:hypothetical protein
MSYTRLATHQATLGESMATLVSRLVIGWLTEAVMGGVLLRSTLCQPL